MQLPCLPYAGSCFRLSVLGVHALLGHKDFNLVNGKQAVFFAIVNYFESAFLDLSPESHYIVFYMDDVNEIIAQELPVEGIIIRLYSVFSAHSIQ